jgi:hypothetical protein
MTRWLHVTEQHRADRNECGASNAFPCSRACVELQVVMRDSIHEYAPRGISIHGSAFLRSPYHLSPWTTLAACGP